MPNSPVYRAHSVPDLLNCLPVLFGFVPEESLIGIQLSEEQNKFGFRLRIDLPTGEVSAEFISTITPHLDTRDGHGVVLIALSSDRRKAARVLSAISRAISTSPIKLAVWATESHWGHLDSSRTHEWVRDACHESVTQAIAEGMVINAKRTDIEADYRTHASVDELVQMERWQHDYRVQEQSTVIEGITGAIRAIRRDLNRLTAGELLNEYEYAQIGIRLRNVEVRDYFWFGISRTNARKQLESWTQIASRSVGVWRCAPLALASFSAWQAGDGVRTLIAAEASLREDPHYGLATLMLRVVEQGLPPESWANLRIDRRNIA